MLIQSRYHPRARVTVRRSAVPAMGRPPGLTRRTGWVGQQHVPTRNDDVRTVANCRRIRRPDRHGTSVAANAQRRPTAPIPEQIARGVPALCFPRPWSIYRWIGGETATDDTVRSLTRFACALAAFLAALYSCDATDGPVAEPHSHGVVAPSPFGTARRVTRSTVSGGRSTLPLPPRSGRQQSMPDGSNHLSGSTVTSPGWWSTATSVGSPS